VPFAATAQTSEAAGVMAVVSGALAVVTTPDALPASGMAVVRAALVLIAQSAGVTMPACVVTATVTDDVGLMAVVRAAVSATTAFAAADAVMAAQEPTPLSPQRLQP
jgi:hypothetical protein